MPAHEIGTEGRDQRRHRKQEFCQRDHSHRARSRNPSEVANFWQPARRQAQNANGRTKELVNTNRVLRNYALCNGMKTGYTEAAGHCLIASGARPGRDIIVVVLGDSKAGVWRDASALLSWGLWM